MSKQIESVDELMVLLRSDQDKVINGTDYIIGSKLIFDMVLRIKKLEDPSFSLEEEKEQSKIENKEW